jgi:hypothetical protein
MEERRNGMSFNHLEDLGIYGKIILKWILMKYSVRCELNSSELGKGPVA